MGDYKPEHYDALIDIVEESILSASDEEIEEDCRLAGIDSKRIAARVKRLFSDVVKESGRG